MSYELYLCHHGIKGMHWGIRRFQNRDGSLTLAGRKRTSSGTENEDNKESLGKTLFTPSIKDGKRTVSPAQQGLKETNNTVRNLQNLNKHVSNFSKQKNKVEGPTKKQSSDMAKMSDKELEKTIRRMNLERQYMSMTKPPTRKTGYDKVNDILSVAGDLSGIALSLATVAGTVYKIKHG